MNKKTIFELKGMTVGEYESHMAEVQVEMKALREYAVFLCEKYEVVFPPYQPDPNNPLNQGCHL